MSKVIAGPIKVLQLIHNSGITGPGRIVYSLAKDLDRKEFLMDVLCPKGGYLSDDLRRIGVKVIPLELGNIWNINYIFRIYRILRKEDYHIFHIQSGQLNAFSKVIGKLLGIPVIVFTEHLSAESHGWIKNKITLFIHFLFHRVSNMMVDGILAVSATTRDSFIKRQKIDSKKITTIYNGVDTQRLKRQETDTEKIRDRWGIPQDIPVVGVVARLSPEKGHRIFILAAKEVLRKVPNIKFFIVGEGTERCDIEDLIEKLGMKKSFILTGFQKDIYGIMDIMDILVQPSLGESFGLAVVEAMVRKKAVISSDIGCFREIIEDNENGVLFPVGDYHKLAEKILRLLNNRQFKEEVAIAGQKTVEKKFDIKITVRETQYFYKKLLMSKGFYLRDDYFRKIITGFMDNIKIERNLHLKKINSCCHSIESYLRFIKEQKLKRQEVLDYLVQEDNFLIETFLQFLDQNKVLMDKICLFNNRLFKEIIQEKAITSKDYDERIKMQTLQFQIDNYYNPKDQAQRRRIDIVLSILQPKKGERILDVGCGVGTFAYHCARRGAKAAGVDYSKESIEIARQLIEHFGVSASVEFNCCDATKSLPYADMSFDKILAVDFIEHIDDSQKKDAILEMMRVLRPRGFICIFTPNRLRERIGLIKGKLTRFFGVHVPETRLHYGLTQRFKFERMLKKMGLIFKRQFFDVNKPWLAKIPLFKEVLSLNICWVIKNSNLKSDDF